MKLKGVIFSLLALILTGFLLMGAFNYFVYFRMERVLRSGAVQIPTGASLDDQAGILFREGFLADSAEYKAIARRMGYGSVRPGNYALKQGMSYRDLLHLIGKGYQTPVRLTFNNIRSRERLAAVLSKQIEPDSALLMDVLSTDSLTQKYGFDTLNVLSLFIPDTYEVYWNITPEKLMERMKREYDRFWEKPERREALERSGLTRQEVSVLASIVDEETNYVPEMPVIAGVYLARLKKGMPLQADPTVKYALGDPTLKRILHKHLQVDSPFNTYRRTGLPPAPISLPSVAAVDAVLHPAQTDALYFCASDELNGRHKFAATLSEHNRNARAYARALDRAGIK